MKKHIYQIKVIAIIVVVLAIASFTIWQQLSSNTTLKGSAIKSNAVILDGNPGE